MKQEEANKEVALRLVRRFDESALDDFDDLWGDLTKSPDADRPPETEHGSGAGVPLDAWSLIIIPLIGALSKKLVDVSVDAVAGWIKRRRGGAEDPKNVEVARAVVEEWKTAEEANPTD